MALQFSLPKRRSVVKNRPFDWERFDSAIDRSGNCWIWIGRKDTRGYGVVWKDGRPQRAHRVSYERATGDSLGECVACHRCDNPSCVRPDHIFPGTHSDNFKDMWAKGRSGIARGERAAAAILTEAEARATITDPRSARLVAAEYGVSPSTIKAIRRGQNWKHLGGTPRRKFRPSPSEREEIRSADKSMIAALCEKFGVPRQAIRDIRRKTRRH